MKIPKLPKKEKATPKKLSIREAMAAGWQLFRTKFWTCFWMLILAGVVVLIPHFLIWFFCVFLHQGPLLNLILLILYPAAIIIVVIVSLGTYNVLLRLLDDQDVTVVHLVSKSGKLITYFIAGILYGLAVSLGLLLFFIPGVMILLAFQFYPYLIVDQDTGPIQSLKASRAITAGARWKLFFLAMILGLIQGIGCCLWFTIVAPFLAMMYVFLTFTCAYRLMLINTPPEKLPFQFSYTPPVETTSNKSSDDTTEDPVASQIDRLNQPAGPKELSIADRAEMMDIGIAKIVENQDKGEKLNIATKEAVSEAVKVLPKEPPNAPTEAAETQESVPAPKEETIKEPEEPAEEQKEPIREQKEPIEKMKEPINNESQEAKNDIG